MNAVAATISTDARRLNFLTELWNMQIPSGQWRYFDGMLYMLGFLAVSGNYHIYTPI